VSCGQSRRLLKMTLILSPIIVGSYAIGLPFGIKGVALSGSVVLLASLPWIVMSSFRGTNLNLKRLGQAIVCPVSTCLASVGLAELAIHLIAPRSICLQLLVAALSCTMGYLLSLLIPQVRREVALLKSLIDTFRSGSSPNVVESVV